jgi:DNA polymerase (family 10)
MTTAPPTNLQIAALLNEYATLLELRGESAYRTIAYRRGAEAIAELDHPAANCTVAELQEIEGIGKTISGIVREIASRGSFRALDQVREILPSTLTRFLELPGVGVKTALRLYESLGVATLDDLREAAVSGRIAATKGLGPRIERAVVDGLAQIAIYEGRHSLASALPLAERLLRAMRERGWQQVSPVGSLRRWRETVGDLDFLIASDDPAAIFSSVAAMPDIGDELGRDEFGGVRFALLGSDLTVQVNAAPPSRWGSGLARFTGSSAHRDQLLALGQEIGLGDPFARDFATEEELYAALGLPFIAPELREGRGEIAAACAGRLPELITANDIRGDLHAHSTWSDGAQTIAQMAQAAIARGYDYLSISDHTHSLAIANGLDEDRLCAQWEEIDRLNAELAPFRLLKSAEVELRRDGTLDLPDAVLAELDIVIASLHTGLRGDRKSVTDRLLSAINNPHVDIIAHPSGRIVGGRAGADYDWDAVFAAAAATRTALEINAGPDRLDLTDERAREAADAGITLTIDCDAHAVDNLAWLPFGISVARRAWVTPAQVLNTHELDHILAWARER